jgi:hypothetical protein
MKKNLFIPLTFIGILFLASCQKANEKLFNTTWAVTESCDPSGDPGPYDITLTGDQNDEYKFTISGLGGASVTVNCNISTSDDFKFSASRQAVSPDIDVEIPSGTLSSDYKTITFSYKVYDSALNMVVDECNSTATLK